MAVLIMKKRSLIRMTVLDIITLGLYEIVWFTKTRNEMVAKYGSKIPNSLYMIAVKLFQFIGFFAVIVLIFWAIPSSERTADKINSIPRPSEQCFVDYEDSLDRVQAGGEPTVSADCKNTFDRYYNSPPDRTPYLIIAAILIPLAMITLEAFYLTRWFIPYSKASVKVTGSNWSRGTVMAMTLLLIQLPAGVTRVWYMLVTQKAFNRS